MKRATLALLRLAAAAILALPASAHADTPALRIGWVYAMANAPALIADKKGYYSEEGLKVELKSFGDGPVVQQALSAGELDMAYIGAVPVFQWYARGLQSRILAKVNYGQAALIAGSAAPVKSLADLRGRKVAGVARGSGMDVLLRGAILRDIGKLDAERDLQVVNMPVGNMNAALERGVTDAAFSWEPFVSEALLRGSARLVLDVNQHIPRYPWYVLMAVPRTLAGRPDDVVKVLRAHRKAIRFLNEHPDDADRIIADAFNIAAIKTADGKSIAPEAVVREARKRLGWSDQIAPSDLQFIQRQMNDAQALGYLNRPLKASEVVDLSWQQRAAQGQPQAGGRRP
ncbi:ABC transporter substrate-binding protein [Oxalobacteraceae bacterium A2-2]